MQSSLLMRTVSSGESGSAQLLHCSSPLIALFDWHSICTPLALSRELHRMLDETALKQEFWLWPGGLWQGHAIISYLHFDVHHQ